MVDVLVVVIGVPTFTFLSRSLSLCISAKKIWKKQYTQVIQVKDVQYSSETTPFHPFVSAEFPNRVGLIRIPISI